MPLPIHIKLKICRNMFLIHLKEGIFVKQWNHFFFFKIHLTTRIEVQNRGQWICHQLPVRKGKCLCTVMYTSSVIKEMKNKTIYTNQKENRFLIPCSWKDTHQLIKRLEGLANCEVDFQSVKIMKIRCEWSIVIRIKPAVSYQNRTTAPLISQFGKNS